MRVRVVPGEKAGHGVVQVVYSNLVERDRVCNAINKVLEDG